MTFFILLYINFVRIRVLYPMWLKFYHNHARCQGTGSYPNPPPGRHRSIRRIPRNTPRQKPYFSIAWAVYSLHVGINLHAARPPINGETQAWYMRTNPIAARTEILFFWFFMYSFYIAQRSAYSGTPIWAFGVQYVKTCDKNIVQIITQISFIMPNPITQQPFGAIALGCQFKHAFGRGQPISGPPGKSGWLCAHKKYRAARVQIIFSG